MNDYFSFFTTFNIESLKVWKVKIRNFLNSLTPNTLFLFLKTYFFFLLFCSLVICMNTQYICVCVWSCITDDFPGHELPELSFIQCYQKYSINININFYEWLLIETIKRPINWSNSLPFKCRTYRKRSCKSILMKEV